jgi:hypothetical protein
MAAEWIGFKCGYPYADYFTDSYTYIWTAARHDFISYRPVGYSLFLRLVHLFSVSDTAVVTLQYLLLQGAALGLVLSLRRWCNLRTGVVAILMAFLLLNPAIPYVANYISSDAVFIALSLIWLTVLMGLVRDPRWWRLGWQVILLFAIFHLRYTALFYPAVAALTILLTRRGWPFKLAGAAASVLVVVISTLWIREITKRETGAALFSAFSGWQIANNALNLYRHIPVDTMGLPSPDCAELAGYVRDYFHGSGRKPADTGEMPPGAPELQAAPATTEYMWLRASPLHRYMQAYRKRFRLSYFDAWNRVGIVFSRYGYFVARKHPIAFLRYYGWPSAISFFLPPLDVFAVYNGGSDQVDPMARDWFRYPSTQVRACSLTFQGRLLAPMPGIYLLLNTLFVAAAVSFLPFRSRTSREPVFTGSFRLASAFLLAYAFFSIFASPSVFRYQVLPMTILFIFSVCAISKSRPFSLN